MSIQASQERDSSCLTDRKREVLAEGRLPQHLTAMEMLSGPVHVLLPAAELPARPCSLRAGFTQAPSLLPLRPHRPRPCSPCAGFPQAHSLAAVWPRPAQQPAERRAEAAAHTPLLSGASVCSLTFPLPGSLLGPQSCWARSLLFL